jgi:guanylate kinase
MRDPSSGRRRGILFVMTGASGVGKDTIRRAASDVMANVVYSISATTRPRRIGETDGVQYHFVDRERFEAMVNAGAMLEHASYVGDLYGTPAAPVDAAIAGGRDVLVEVELDGARQVKVARPEAVMLFIAPPSLAELERRLRGRGTDPEIKIQKRLARAREEIRAVREFDYVIVNDEVGRAVATFRAILAAERARARLLTDEQLAAFLQE